MHGEINSTINVLPPFKYFCQTIGELPSSYLESMTYYETMVWLCNYLGETIIPTVNNTGDAVTELQGLYIQLQDYVNTYFDNLDVQEEINNKLDDMANDGSLSRLLAPFFQEINNKIDMQNTKIDSLMDFNPIPVASTSDMTDTTKVYLNTTDGKWYYYNGTAWAIGGTYQSPVSDIVNTDDLLKSLYLINSNYVDDLTYYIGKGINYETGNSFNNDKYIRTQRLSTENVGKLYVLESDVYLMSPRYYNNDLSNTWSDDYLGYSDWNNLIYTSIYPRCALVFKRVDEAEITESDLETIKSNLKLYKLTDDSLTKPSVPADSKTVGDIINSIKYDYFEKNNNKSYIIDFNDYYPEVEENTIQGNTYASKGWFAGYLRSDTGFSNSYSYITTSYDISQIKGSIPKYIKIKINDLTDMSEPYIRIGWLDDSENIILHTSHDLEEAIIKIPSYPNLANTSGGLYITIGRWENISIPISELEDRITNWVSENVEITFYFDEIFENREISNNKFESKTFVYNESYDFALKLPKNYTAYTDKKTPLIILCHGYSSTISAEAWGSSEDMITLVDNFTNNGYAVIDVGQVTTADWCNPDLIEKYVLAINYVCDNYNVIPKYIYGESMGSLIALTLQQEYNIKAIAIGGPRLDLEYVYEHASDGDKTIISSNLGFTDGFDKYKATGWSKTIYEITDSNNNTINYNTLPPTFYLYGNSDSQVSEATAKMESLKRGGNIVKSETYTSNHHNICYLKAGTSLNDVLDWFSNWV